MNRVHCECCDRVIRDTEKRWTLRVGLAKGLSENADAEPRDYCPKCFREKGTSILNQIMSETDWKL